MTSVAQALYPGKLDPYYHITIFRNTVTEDILNKKKCAIMMIMEHVTILYHYHDYYDYGYND